MEIYQVVHGDKSSNSCHEVWKVALEWTTDTTRPFTNLKEAVCTTKYLSISDFEKPFLVKTNAFSMALGTMSDHKKWWEGSSKSVY